MATTSKSKNSNWTVPTIVAALLVISLFASGRSYAQQVRAHDQMHYGQYWQGYGYRPHYHAATVKESHLRGKADVIRAQGEFNLQTSAALINLEEARSRGIDNDAKFVRTYHETRHFARQMRHGTPEEKAVKRAANLRQRELYAQRQQLNSPDTGPVDRLTGKIDWPLVLKSAAYKQSRSDLDAVFASRARQNGYLSDADVRSIHMSSEAMLAQLKTQIKSLSPRDYLAAKNFVRGLAEVG